MDFQKFIAQLPEQYENWGLGSMCPKNNQFEKIIEQAEVKTHPNILALLNFALACLENEEAYCQLGCLGTISLIAALLNHPNKMAYAVDNCSELPVAEVYLEQLNQSIIDFNLENQVFFCDQDLSDFFLQFRENEIEDKIGVLYYDSYPAYRAVMLSLLLVKPCLSDQALIIVHNAHEEQVQKAVQDFVLAHSQCQILLNWQLSTHAILGLKNICILSWDTQQQQYSFISQSLISSGKKVVINVGCGPEGSNDLPDIFQSDEWQEIRLDINSNVRPDIIGSITDLSAIPNNSVDAIFSSHNLEHIYHHEVPIALTEFRRVLKPGGFALITLPDIQKVAEYIAQGKLEETLYVSPAGPIAAIDILYGLGISIAKGNIYMAHKTAFTANSLKEKMEAAGFENVKVRQEWLNLWATGYC